MKTKQLNLFKLVNVFMVAFCICAVYMNHVGVNVISADAAEAAIAAGGAGALFSAFIVPVLVAGGIGAGVM